MHLVRHRLMPLLALPLLGGCAASNRPTPAQLSRGYMLLLAGVESTPLSMVGLAEGLRDAGVDCAIDVELWGDRPFGTFRNLRNYELNRQRAAALADRLARYAREYPGRPTAIVGYSGGGGMAVFIAEALPPDVMLDRIILIGAALSPTYDLDKAIGRCRNGMVSFYSRRDTFLLGWGTRTFGTMDRQFCESAGMVGFQDAAGRLRNGRIRQIAWVPQWASLWHFGNHAGWTSRSWVRHVLAPVARIDERGVAASRPAGAAHRAP